MKTDIANCIEILEKCSTKDYVSSLTLTGTHLDFSTYYHYHYCYPETLIIITIQ